jgi:hypothetical protein
MIIRLRVDLITYCYWVPCLSFAIYFGQKVETKWIPCVGFTKIFWKKVETNYTIYCLTDILLKFQGVIFLCTAIKWQTI